MDKILKDILNYEKIIIVSNQEDDLLSKMIFDSIKVAINKQTSEFNEKADTINKSRTDLTDIESLEYRYDDLFYKDVGKTTLRKYYNNKYNNYLLRVKGNGYNIGFMGLVKSQQIVRNSNLLLAVRLNKCTILHDRLNDYLRRECDLDGLYRSQKISKILKK